VLVPEIAQRLHGRQAAGWDVFRLHASTSFRATKGAIECHGRSAIRGADAARRPGDDGGRRGDQMERRRGPRN